MSTAGAGGAAGGGAKAAPAAGAGGKAKGEMYKQGVKESDVRMANIIAAKGVADAVRTSLGPRGMDKMIQGETGEVSFRRVMKLWDYNIASDADLCKAMGDVGDVGVL